MDKIKMKIVGFNVLNGTLQIKFSSDTSEKKIDEYPAQDFNVVEMHDAVTIDEILIALAQTGHQFALQQEVAEQTSKDNKKIKIFKSLIGKQFEYNVFELFNPSCPSENQPKTKDLMII